MRKWFLPALLIGLAAAFLHRLVPPLGVQPWYPWAALLLVGIAAGEVASAIRLPRLTGYMAAGLALGPSALGTILSSSIPHLTPIKEMALAMIALLAGAEMDLTLLRRHAKLIFSLAMTRAIGIPLLIGGGVLAYFYFQPVDFPTSVAIAGILGILAVANSPATVLGVIQETRAKGTMTTCAIGVTLLADLSVLILMASFLPVATILVHHGGVWEWHQFEAALWEIGGSLAVGIVVGEGLVQILRHRRSYLGLALFGLSFLAMELAHIAGLSGLLVCATAGFFSRWRDVRTGHAIASFLEKQGSVVMLLFFTGVGASIHLGDLAKVLPAVLILGSFRLIAVWVTTSLGGRFANSPNALSSRGWTGFISQRGLILGMTVQIERSLPGVFPFLDPLVVGLVLFSEMGPPLFRHAIRKNGEARR